MHDVHFPTTDGRTLIVSRYTELNADQKLLVKRLKLDVPSQVPAAHHRAGGAAGARCDRAGVVETFGVWPLILLTFSHQSPKLAKALQAKLQPTSPSRQRPGVHQRRGYPHCGQSILSDLRLLRKRPGCLRGCKAVRHFAHARLPGSHLLVSNLRACLYRIGIDRSGNNK